MQQMITTCWECRKCRPRETSSATLRPRRHQLSGCAAPLLFELLCSALNRSPPYVKTCGMSINQHYRLHALQEPLQVLAEHANVTNIEPFC